MVTTRGHPKEFPEPELPPSLSPSKSPSKRSSSPAKRSFSSSSPVEAANGMVRSPSKRSTSTSVTKTPSASRTTRSTSSTSKAPARIPFATPIPLKSGIHTPPPLLIIWLLVSLPLVIWDTIYVLGRPHTMPGGWLHKPIWSPYALYGQVDHSYGFVAWDKGLGWTSSQGFLNLIETVGYIWYFWIVWKGLEGVPKGESKMMALVKGEHKGSSGCALAVTLTYAVSVMTVSKTVLYWLNEYFSQPRFMGLRHNDAWTLFWIFIIPNIMWIIVPSYMAWVLGREIVGGLERPWGKSRTA